LEHNTKHPPERFSREPIGGFCSAFKVAPRVVATAAHCILSQDDCRTIAFVTGFELHSPTSRPDKGIISKDVYSCKGIVAHDSSEDWALVEVDRDLTDIPTAVLRGSPSGLKEKDGVTAIGYPLGLPVKIAGNAFVRSLSAKTFLANIDAYKSSSGSPVFSTEALKRGAFHVEGILIEGKQHFVTNAGCAISQICEVDGCRGETVTYSGFLEAKLKQ
jgi:V8-like Glu-specific endopeptidase